MLTPQARERRPMTFSWAFIRTQYASTVAEQFDRTRALWLEHPAGCLERLLHDHRACEDFARIVRCADWANVWREETVHSGVVSRRVAVSRHYQHTVNEACWQTVEEGAMEDRPKIYEHWKTAGT
jgi:hypothetical protein